MLQNDESTKSTEGIESNETFARRLARGERAMALSKFSMTNDSMAKYVAAFLAALVAGCTLFSSVALAQPRDISSREVEASIRKCVDYLYREQINNGVNRGGWRGHSAYQSGQTALVTLALLSAQESPSDPRIKKALDYLRRTRPIKNYEVSLHCMALCAAEPNKDLPLIKADVEILVKNQRADGGWSYDSSGSSDESNSQFAVLALWEASKLDIDIPDDCWAKAYDYWNARHQGSGWGYLSFAPSGSMTCAGIASMLILRDASENADAMVANGKIQCCVGNHNDARVDPVVQGFNWLTANFTVQSNPHGGAATWGVYYLYAVERVGRLTGQRFFGTHDWYREGAAHLMSIQTQVSGAIQGAGMEAAEPITTTAMALLFLSKGKRQVVIGHLRHGDGSDWQPHRRSVQNLTGQIEKVWKRELSWQAVNFQAATVATLLETPVLYISGSQTFKLTDAQRNLLREYVENGGIIFGEACNGDGCNGAAFDASFRREMELIFEKPLTRLPPQHPVWSAEALIDPNALPEGFWLYGLDACCRTSVIYSPMSLSCRWELAKPWGKNKRYGGNVDADIENAVKLGINIASYATGRELKEKLDAVEIVQAPSNYQPLPRGALKLPKIQHGGGADDASRAVLNLLDTYYRDTKGLIDRDTPMISLADDSVEQYPFLYIHGRNRFVFSEAERAGLRKHFEHGGFVIGDAICGAKEFSTSVRDEFLKALPEAKWRTLDPNHTFMLRDEANGFDGYDITQVELVDPSSGSGDLGRAKRRGPPEIHALEWRGRIVMVFSPNDLSCAMESKHSIQCKGYVRDDAFRIAINMILYGLSQ